jgi:hypothetical protein
VTRLIIASTGALVVTLALLLAMNEVTSRFREKDPTRYFSIDVVQPLDTGRRKPEPPRAPELPPERAQPRYEAPVTTLPFERPPVDEVPTLPEPRVAPRFEPDRGGGGDTP